MAGRSYEDELHEAVAEYYADPLGFVLAMYPWGEPGSPLEREPGPDAWQSEHLEAIGRHVTSQGFDGSTPVDALRSSVSSGHGIGKALSCRTVLHTPTGYREWGTLKPGELVWAPDGTATKVEAVWPQGTRPMYRVTFDDGSSVEADADHLWLVRGRQDRRSRGGAWREMTTRQILAAGVVRPNGRTLARQWEIPSQAAVLMAESPTAVHPYTMGVWLGDGTRRTGLITNPDPEVIGHLREVGETVTAAYGPHVWRIHGLSKGLRTVGQYDCHSYRRSVPEWFLHNGPEARAEVLRGLLDTDGECNRQGSVVFNSTSRTLANDVVWLARSLGGKARIQPTAKAGRYRNPEGCRVECRPCWRVTLTMPAGFRCFYVKRKQARVKAVESRYLTRWIDRITPIGDLPASCISVAHPSRCFLANDFVVTHNSVQVAWIVDWLMSTRPHCQGTITSNTITQLHTKTWAGLARWTKLCRTGHWFEVNTERMFRRGYKESWFCAPQSSKETNSEAFAGQHAKDSTSFYVFDEASAIPDVIWDVAEGGLTDGEPMIFAFGNATRSTGRFYEACFGRERKRWAPIIIDSRTSRFTNKAQIREWIETYGEDSDFVRVRVRGLPPNASDVQYIASSAVFGAQGRAVEPLEDEPLVVGLDVARGGGDECVMWFRRGPDARSIPPIIIPGEKARDSMHVVSVAADVLGRGHGRESRPVAMMFVDGTGIGGPICDRLRQLGNRNVVEVQFGGESPDPKLANMRAFIWSKLREWLPRGSIPTDARLETDLTGPGYHHDKSDRLVLESKESMKARGLDSPDRGDALALTFAAPVKSKGLAGSRAKPRRPFEAYATGGQGWMG